jgi:hypothetical protein
VQRDVGGGAAVAIEFADAGQPDLLAAAIRRVGVPVDEDARARIARVRLEDLDVEAFAGVVRAVPGTGPVARRRVTRDDQAADLVAGPGEVCVDLVVALEVGMART